MSLSILPKDKCIISNFKKMFYNFIWNKGDLVKRNTLIDEYKDDDLRMIDIELYEPSLKDSWVSQLFGEKYATNSFLERNMLQTLLVNIFIDKLCKNHILLLFIFMQC